jgi:hypothetical protein
MYVFVKFRQVTSDSFIIDELIDDNLFSAVFNLSAATWISE